MHENYHGIGVAPTDFNDKLVCGHPNGRVSILWRSTLDIFITPLDFEYGWITGITITRGTKKTIILCIYMSWQGENHGTLYMEFLGTLSAIISDVDCTCFFIVGDWNADIEKICNRFGTYLQSFLLDTGTIASSLPKLSVNSCTYTSDVLGTSSWIDHCISSADANDLIQETNILYDVIGSDHYPVEI